MNTENNPAVLKSESNRQARSAAKDIRAALKNNCLYVYATDARDGKEYRIVDASTKAGTLLGQEPRQGIWFPVAKWEQR